jgi:hypothetical protein
MKRGRPRKPTIKIKDKVLRIRVNNILYRALGEICAEKNYNISELCRIYIKAGLLEDLAEDWDTMNKKFLTDLGFGPKADEGDEPPEEEQEADDE